MPNDALLHISHATNEVIGPAGCPRSRTASAAAFGPVQGKVVQPPKALVLPIDEDSFLVWDRSLKRTEPGQG